MAVTKTFKDAVAKNEIRKVRIMMKDSLLVDPTFQEFEQMTQAAAGMKGLYDTHDEEPFEMDENKWTDDYMNKLMVDLVYNFSHERIEHLKKVVRKLRPVSQDNLHKDNKTGTGTNSVNKKNHSHKTLYQEQKERDQRNGDYLGIKMAAGAVIGAGVGAVVAGAAEMSALGVGAAVIIGAGAGAGAAYMLCARQKG